MTPKEVLWYPTTHDKSGEKRRSAVPGHEFSGVIAAVGAETTGFAIASRAANRCTDIRPRARYRRVRQDVGLCYDAEPDEVRSVLQGAVEVGGTCIATAVSSQHGACETLIGVCVALNRHDFLSLRRAVAVPRRIQRGSCSTTAARHGCTRSSIIINTHAHT